MDVIWDISGISDANTVLGIRLDEVYLVNFLEGLSGGLVHIVGATDEQHRPGIHPCVSNSTDSVCVSWPRDADTCSGNTRQVAGISGTVACLLLVAKAVVFDTYGLDGIAELYDRDSDNAIAMLDLLFGEGFGQDDVA